MEGVSAVAEVVVVTGLEDAAGVLTWRVIQLMI